MAAFQQFSVNTPQNSAQRPQRRGIKVKTGCGTCRTRKVKCDEAKPSCQKCTLTGRICEGYASPFRIYGGDQAGKVNKVSAGSVPGNASPQDFSPEDVASLQRCFSTKTLFEYVALSCEDEARQVLQASLTDLAIRHAVSSLRTLRGDLEVACPMQLSSSPVTPSTHISSAASSPQAHSPSCMTSSVISYAAVSDSSPAYGYGLQQYCMALGGLASILSLVDAGGHTDTVRSGPLNAKAIRSALLCCQVFISIEQMRGNYAAMAQHVVQGLSILYENRARQRQKPLTDDGNRKDGESLPALDVYIIKLFAAPCKFADVSPPDRVDADAISVATVTTDSSASTSTAAMSRLRAIAPDMRTELTRLSASILSYLAKVTLAAPDSVFVQDQQQPIAERSFLLASLDTWLLNLERQQLAKGPHPELLSVSFLRFFHQILRVVMLSTQHSGYYTAAQLLGPEYAELQSIASRLGDRFQAYGRQSESRGGPSPE